MATSIVETGAGDNVNEHTVRFLLDCKEKGSDLCSKHRPSIFMVPSAYRDLSPGCYTPKVVSIGPLHRQNKILQRFEAEKTCYLHRLLDCCSGSSPERMLQECVIKVSMKMKLIRACYEESTTYNDEELTRMMVVDGCFILDYINISKDEFLKNGLINPLIALDLMLVENQIPFFVLGDIFDSTILKIEPGTSLNEYIANLLVWYNIFNKDIISGVSGRDSIYDHILGLVHKSLGPGSGMSRGLSSDSASHSAMELDKAGLHFRPNKDVDWALSMKVELPRFSCFPWFWCKPTLRMPKLIINGNTDTILRNLIMYEHFCADRLPNYVTSFAWAMDYLINTPEDVAKLIKSGVLVNDLSSNEDATNRINKICKEVTLLEFFYTQEWHQLDRYYNSYWPNLVAGLKRTYFSSPWTMIALFAAIILFILTVVQTRGVRGSGTAKNRTACAVNRTANGGNVGTETAPYGMEVRFGSVFG